MDVFLLIIRLLLAIVFLVAGLAKMLDRAGSRQSFVDFGFPERLARPLALALPPVELAVAMLLVFNTTSWVGAIGTFSLLLLFIAVMTYNLAKGRKPDCHCFGQLHSDPIGWDTIARNSILALLAAFLIWQGPDRPGLSVLAIINSLSITLWFGIVFATLVIAAVAAEGWFIVNLLRQNGRLLVRLEALEAQVVSGNIKPIPTPAPTPVLGLAVGTPAPTFALPQLDGKEITLDGLRSAGKPVLLLFTDPACGPCGALMPQVAVWQREHASRLSIVIASRGAKEQNQALQKEHGVTNILLQQDREVSLLYQAYGTPSAVLIRPDGTIGSPLAGGEDAIASLIASSTQSPRPAQIAPPRKEVKRGDPAPTFSLKDLDGKEVRSEDLRGKQSLLLFWSPTCGFCQRMLGQLKDWEASALPDAPQLVLISTGSVQDYRAMGLRSPILLDQSFAAGHAFGVSGTPSAILIDAEGKIASEVAVGAPSVLALASAKQDQPELAAHRNTAIRMNGGAS